MLEEWIHWLKLHTPTRKVAPKCKQESKVAAPPETSGVTVERVASLSLFTPQKTTFTKRFIPLQIFQKNPSEEFQSQVQDKRYFIRGKQTADELLNRNNEPDFHAHFQLHSCRALNWWLCYLLLNNHECYQQWELNYNLKPKNNSSSSRIIYGVCGGGCACMRVSSSPFNVYNGALL